MWAKRFAILGGLAALMLAANVGATSHTGVDTNTSQVLSHKELDGTNFFDAFRYNGKLTIQDVHADNTSGTVAHRVEYCPVAVSGDVTMTMPASPALGEVYTLINLGAHTCSLARAGSQLFNGTDVRIDLSTAPAGEHCLYLTSNYWYCEGIGAGITPTPTPTNTPTPTPTNTPTPTPTNTPTPTPTP